MLNKSVYFPAVCVVLALAAFFVVRQRTLSDIRVGNRSLRQKVDSAPPPAQWARAAETNAAGAATLSVDERNELLRLRGQIPPLRAELKEASNRVAGLAQPGTQTAVIAGNASNAVQRAGDAIQAFTRSEPYRNANALARAVQTYLQQHAGQIPDDLAAVQVPGNPAFADGTIQRFELVRTGKIEEDPSVTPYLLIAHEKEPQQLPDGRWVRLYIQANGGLTIIGPSPNRSDADDSDFVRNTEKWGRERALKTSQAPTQLPTQSLPQ